MGALPFPVRKRLRIAGMDYRYPGPYFVTACTIRRECLFGEIRDGRMVLNRLGARVLREWHRLPLWNPWVVLDARVVMPNHFHGVVMIGTEDEPPAAPRPDLGRVMARFKSRSAAEINRFRGTPGVPVWQRGYYETIVRSEHGLDMIRDYVMGNPGMWEWDSENPLRQRPGGLRPPLQGPPPPTATLP